MSHLTRLIKHATYANTISTLCLFLLMGAGAHAAGLGKNTVGSRQIKDGQVGAVDLAGNAVTSAKVASDALSGSDVKESTLQGVNAATLGGRQVKRIHYDVPVGTGVQTVLEFPGEFRIDASCQPDGDQLDIAAFTAEDNSSMTQLSVRSTNARDDDGIQDVASKPDFFDADEGWPIENVLTNSQQEQVFLDLATPSGGTFQVQLVTKHLVSSCWVNGFAIGG